MDAKEVVILIIEVLLIAYNKVLWWNAEHNLREANGAAYGGIFCSSSR